MPIIGLPDRISVIHPGTLDAIVFCNRHAASRETVIVLIRCKRGLQVNILGQSQDSRSSPIHGALPLLFYTFIARVVS
jgi:hypothetical protein